ncbi:MAG: hypothetical protein AAB483_03360 [Patescibacteria group bacterium]
MASHYSDQRDFIQHISPEIIKEYLKKIHSLDYTVPTKEETREESADRTMQFIKKQEKVVQDRILMELDYVNALSSANHIEALCALAPHIKRKELIEDKSETNDERALLAYINYTKEFDEYYSMANIENCAVKELRLPKVKPIAELMANPETMSQFEKQIQGIYRQSYKGEQCKIKTFIDNDKLILRAYLEDLTTRDTAFVNGKLDEKVPRRAVFDAVFVYSQDRKMLGVRAIGGRDVVRDLQKLFCSHFLGIQDINTDEELYTLPSIKDIIKLNLVADATDGVERVYLKSIRLKSRGSPHKIYIDIGGRTLLTGTDAIQAILKELWLDANAGWEAEGIKITVVFRQSQSGKGRRKQVSVNITPPNHCDLKNRPQDDVVRKLLKDWGLYTA